MTRPPSRRRFLQCGAAAFCSGGAFAFQASRDCSPACLNRYPGGEWEFVKSSDAGFDERLLKEVLPTVGLGGVISRHGYIAASWGDLEASVQTASLGKSFTGICLALAVDAGLVKLNDLVWKSWTGEGELSHKHKYLNVGHHRKMTWRHLSNMTGGFPDIDLSSPDGEMGDILSNYSKRPPGGEFEYSDGGMWRLAQALTKLWGKDLKQLLDEKIFSQIGVPADRWQWLPGKTMYENLLYPFWPGYGRYLDPPWEIDGHIVRAGQGWVVINAKDLARFGYLILRRGRWKGKQLISDAWMHEIFTPQSRLHSGNGGRGYSFQWQHDQGTITAGGANINWQAGSRISVAPQWDLVVASIRTNYMSRQVMESAYTFQADYDWLFRIIQAIKA